MEYIVSALTKYVINQKPQESNKTIFRIDGFEDIRIYDLFCKKIKKQCDSLGLKLIAKLSYPKYTEFKSVSQSRLEFQPSILSMEQNEWVDKDDSLTQYRNILSYDDEKIIIILMGTEVVEDKGGLHDTFLVNSSRIQADIRSKYSSVFNKREWEEEERNCIDILFKWLFDLVPVNLYKLSCLADEWDDIDNIEMFIQRFYKNLPIWGLCKREENLPIVNEIIKSTKKNLLNTNYDFIERNTFKKITKKQFDKYNEKICKYSSDDLLAFSDQYEGWINQSIKSYDEYAVSLSEFILGKNIKALRGLMLNVDFAITEAVLGLKLQSEKTDSTTTQKVYGNPLSAMTGTLFYALINIDAKISESVAKIDFNFTHAKLVNEINVSENITATEQIETNFKNICYVTGGIIDYIAQRNWCLGESEIEVISTPSNFFKPSDTSEQIENGRITALGMSQSVNKIEFSIVFRDFEGNELGKTKDYEWCFANDENWLYSFTDICNKYKELDKRFINTFVPLGINKDLKRLMHLKSEQEFFDVYESIDIEYEDLLTVAEKYSAFQSADWNAEYGSLGTAFIDFCKGITSNGFYNSVDVINSLTESYNKLGNKILENSYTENLKWVLNLYIHAFGIEPNNYSVTRDEETDFCIIPPWHPAILQKLIHQAVFVLDGCEQWWNKNTNNLVKVTQKSVLANIAELEQLSCIHQAIDIFPTVGRQYFGNLHTFGNFCLCGNINAQENIRIKDVLRKEAVFDDDFTESEFKQVDADAQMILDILEDYVKAFPNKSKELSLAFIDPSELQPLVAAIHKYIAQIKKGNEDPDVPIRLTLNILVKPENRGGRNYLSYWVNTFFSQDENTDIKIYLNEWTSKDDIKKYLSINTDIVFMMDLLKVDNFGFIPDIEETTICPRDCKYPMVFKPAPSSQTSVKRRIELTQSQFECATIHSQVVHYNNHLNEQPSKKVVVVKEVCIDRDRHELIDLLHKKAYWVICIDGGMDGALLKNDTVHRGIYSIIGFSTGKGHHGQYNLTVTARESIVTQVKKRFENRVRNLFKWTDERAKIAAEICVKEAGKLDGVSLLSAINPKTYSINEFMAYILTSVQMQSEYASEALNVVIHLDSYRHWFSKDAYNVDSENKLRPDFLNVSAKIDENGKLLLKATVIECKIAKFSNSTEHINKALEQVEHGLSVLTELFKPTPPNDSVRRRYWYAQLYRALAFSQITFHDNTEEYVKLATGLKTILDGDFDIEWNGKVMGYWVDMQGDSLVKQISNGENSVQVLSIPQRIIQKLILGDNEAKVDFVEVIPEIIEDIIPTKYEDDFEEEPSVIEDTEMPTINTDAISQESTGNKKEEFLDSDVSEGQGEQIENIVDTESKELSDVKAYIGKDTRGNSVSWDFGHSKLSNRHLLITGSSGQGKTYFMQTMIKELSEQGISSVVFDYTEGFRLDQLESEFVESLESKISQKIVYFDGVPVNPFRRQELEVLGIKSPEKIADVATRIADILSNVYKLQEQQFSAVYSACKNGMDKYGDNMNMQFFRRELENINSNPSKSVLSKLTPFFDSVIFNCNGEFDWNTITNSNGTLTIFQLTNFVRELQVVITEIMLWDAWHYNKKYGNKDKPFVVILDEAQNLSHKANSPSAKILTEGRKFGWSAWFATQFLKPQLDDSEINRLQQSAVRVYFKPADNDLAITAKQLGPTTNGASNWAEQLRNLQKGQCIVAGERKKLNGDFGPTNPVVTKIASFKERGEIQ
jgi:DNA phosphorothioation-dependent restriction protein DptH